MENRAPSRIERYFPAFLAALALTWCVAGFSTMAVAQGGKSGGASDIPALLKSGALKGREMILASWGGAFSAATQKNFVEPFEAATGVKVTMVAPGSGFAAKLTAQEQANNIQWDLIDAPGSDGDILASLGYLDDYPPSLITALKPLVRPDTLADPWRLSYGQTPYVIACNPAVMKRCPKTPKEFWDAKDFPGPRGVTISLPVKILTIAEEAAGIPRDKLFPLNVPLAIETLEKIKPQVKVWPQTPTQAQQVLADGEVGVEIMASSRANVLKRELPKIEISWDGAAVDPDGWVVPKGAHNADVAFAFILWVAEHPEHQAAWTSTMYLLTPAKNLANMLSPEVRDATAIAHDPVQIPHDVVVKQRKEMQEGMQKLLSGG